MPRKSRTTAVCDVATAATVMVFIRRDVASLTPPDDIGLSDTQLSMIASAIAGGQSLCCQHAEHRERRETIADTESQLAMLGQFADKLTGCRLEALEEAERKVRIARYLEHLVMWDGHTS